MNSAADVDACPNDHGPMVLFEAPGSKVQPF